MKISILTNSMEVPPGLLGYTERRALFAMSRLSDRILKVDIRLSDENGPRGGVDKRCAVQVHLSNTPTVIVDDMDADVYTAIDRAIARAGRAVSKRVDKTFGGYRSKRETLTEAV